MRLYRLGDTGEPVRDIQDRLAALGFNCNGDPRGEFAVGTREAVQLFQRDRGLAPDGIVGPDTWRVLYEAGYRLGDRLLFLRRPMLRGDDVAELQVRLNNLGFDAGKPDGIYGPDTARAVTTFQCDRALASDGVAGPEVLTELRLVTRSALGMGREAVREREWLRSLTASPVGRRVFFDPAGRTPHEAAAAWEAATAAALDYQDLGGLPIISRSSDVVMPERVRARRANRLGAEVVIVFQHAGDDEHDANYSFETARSRSEAGAKLAGILSEVIGGAVEGRASPILRETRAAAVIVARRRLDAEIGRRSVKALERFFAEAGIPGS